MPQGRPVRKVVRNVDVVSVLRLSLVFWLAVAAAFVVAGLLVWLVAGLLGVFTSLSRFMASMGVTHFRLHGGAILRAFVVLAAVFVGWATLITGILAVLYNAVSRLVGGLQVVVIEREAADRATVMSAGSSLITRGPTTGPVPVAAAEAAEPRSPGIAVS